jgi:hypothetical protein
MAKNRYIGKGALVKVDPAGGTTWQTVGLCTNVTPPPQEKATIDCTAMEDAVTVAEVGIEQLSEFSFESLHDPADTVDDAIDTLYGNGANANWQLYTLSGAHVFTKIFTGRVFAIVPTALDKNGVQKRTVKVIRTGAITDAST